jgi:hypothetical protein
MTLAGTVLITGPTAVPGESSRWSSRTAAHPNARIFCWWGGQETGSPRSPMRSAPQAALGSHR